jgi:hypothetical protein
MKNLSIPIFQPYLKSDFLYKWQKIMAMTIILILSSSSFLNAQPLTTSIAGTYSSGPPFPTCIGILSGSTCFDDQTIFCVDHSPVALGPNDDIVVELSDPFGSFSTPTVLARPSNSTGTIYAPLQGKVAISGTQYRIRVVVQTSGVTSLPGSDNGWDISLYHFNFPEEFSTSGIPYFYQCEASNILNSYGGSGTFYYDNPSQLINANPGLTGSIPQGIHSLYFTPAACSYDLYLGQFEIKGVTDIPRSPMTPLTSYTINCGSSISLSAIIDPAEKQTGSIEWLEWDPMLGVYNPVPINSGTNYTTPNLYSSTKYGIYYAMNGCFSNIVDININVPILIPALALPYNTFYKCENVYNLNSSGWGVPGGGKYYLDGTAPINEVAGNNLALSSLSTGPHNLYYFATCNFSPASAFDVFLKPSKPVVSTSLNGCDVTVTASNPDNRSSGYIYQWEVYDQISGVWVPNTTNNSNTFTYSLSLLSNDLRVYINANGCMSDYAEVLTEDLIKYNLPYTEFYQCEGDYDIISLNWISSTVGLLDIDGNSIPNNRLFQPSNYATGTHYIHYWYCNHAWTQQIEIKDMADAPTIASGAIVWNDCNYTQEWQITSLNSRGKDIIAGDVWVDWYVRGSVGLTLISHTKYVQGGLNGCTTPEVQGPGALINCNITYNGSNGHCTSRNAFNTLASPNDAGFSVVSNLTGTTKLNAYDEFFPPGILTHQLCYDPAKRFGIFTATANNSSVLLDWTWEIGGNIVGTTSSSNSSTLQYDMYNGLTPYFLFKVTAKSPAPGNCTFVSYVQVSPMNIGWNQGYHLTSDDRTVTNPQTHQKIYVCDLNASKLYLRPVGYLINGTSLIPPKSYAWMQSGSYAPSPSFPAPNGSLYTDAQYRVPSFGTYSVNISGLIYVFGPYCEISSDEVEVIDASLSASFYITSSAGASPKQLTSSLVLNASFDNATIYDDAFSNYRWYLDDILINTGSTHISPAKAGVYKLVANCCGIEKTTTFTVLPPNDCFAKIVSPVMNFNASITTSSYLGAAGSTGNPGTVFTVDNSNSPYSITGTSTTPILLKMNRNTKIVVEAGYELHLDYCQFSCCFDWQGIVVKSGGHLFISNCTIQDAVIGIYAEEGAEIQLDDNTWINNHNHISITDNALQNSSIFQRNTFDALVNRSPDYYNYNLSYSFVSGKQILLNNGANDAKLMGNTFIGNSISGFSVIGLQVTAANNTQLTYLHASPPLIPSDLPNVFKGSLSHGIYIDNGFGTKIGTYASTTRSFGLPSENEFMENVAIGIFASNAMGLEAVANKFIPAGSRIYDGVVLVNSDNCKIEWNKFLNNYRGLQIYNRNNNQTLTEVLRNEFQNNKYGMAISPEDFPLTCGLCSGNLGLAGNLQNIEFHCNKFFGTPPVGLVPRIDANDIAIIGSGLIPDQGSTGIYISADNDFALDPSFGHTRNVDWDIVWQYSGAFPHYYYEAPLVGGVPVYLNSTLTNSIQIVNGNPVSPGTLGITLTDIKSFGPTSYCSSWSTWKTNPGGIKKDELENISVYPNPAKSTINLKVPDVRSLQIIGIYDMTGRLVLNNGFQVSDSMIQFDLGSLSAGVYELSFIFENKKIIQKIIRE